jgi:adenosylmethionine-8-amino-7-oxononanoate aminotransferase
MNRTQTLIKKDKKYVWHPFTQMKDWAKDDILVIEKGRGNYLYDTDGKRYLDGVSSLWCNVFGHQRRELNRAIENQLEKVAHSTFLGLTNPPAVELAEELVKITPRKLTRVFYSDSGSEAVEIALKMAYQYWQQKGKKEKKEFVTLSDAYHGDTIGSVSLGGMELFHGKYKPLLFKTHKVSAPSFYQRGRNLSLPAFKLKAIEEMEKAVKRNHKKLCAIVMEPLIQGAAGMITHPKSYLKAVRKIADRYGILLILDEVATGFGRTGKMFACEHENVQPDILCLAKGITGGYLPLAATLTSEEIYKGFLGEYSDLKTFFHGHTYTGNPLACSAAFANLKIFKKEKVVRRLQGKVKKFERGLKQFCDLKNVGDIRQCGLMIGIELVKDKKNCASYSLKQKVGIRVIEEARRLGVILRPLGNVIVLMPPLSITSKEIDWLLDVTYKAVKRVTED